MTQQTAGNPLRASSLYVGDLSPEVKEEQLYQVFESVGHVLSLRICRDKATDRSLGYAYVNYATPEDAEHALETLNFSEIEGRPCRIMWQFRDPSLRRSGKGNLYIKNLPLDMDNKTLLDTFSLFGPILSCKVSCDPKTGKSLGFGYVHFENVDNAETAIHKLNNVAINGKTITVENYIANKNSQVVNEWTNCYVKPINPEWDEEKVKSIFAPYGPIQNVAIAKDVEGKSKGYGFVNFEKHDDAVKAVTGLNDTTNEENLVDGKATPFIVCRFMKKAEREKVLSEQFLKKKEERQEKTQGMNLYIKNISEDYTDANLCELFSKYGTITSGLIMRTPEGLSRGFGFVCFASSDDASKAISELNGKTINGKPLYVTLAQKKEDRRAQLAAAMSRNIPRNVPLANPMYPVFYGAMVPRPQMMMPSMPVMPGNMGMYNQMPAGRNNRRFIRKPQMNGKPNGMQRNNNMRAPMMNQGLPAPMSQAVPVQPVPSANNEKLAKIQQITTQIDSMEPINIPQVKEMDADTRRNFLGERLYNLISNLQPERVGKITGMMLELDVDTLLNLFVHPSELVDKVDEAVAVLERN
ncbi:hypothetical protein WA158_004812 [Blastocystis sp. Blastoise]